MDFPDPFASIPEDESVTDSNYKSDKAQNTHTSSWVDFDRRKAQTDDDDSKSASDTSSTSMLPVVSEDDQSGSFVPIR